jgi:hypothetical protein
LQQFQLLVSRHLTSAFRLALSLPLVGFSLLYGAQKSSQSGAKSSSLANIAERTDKSIIFPESFFGGPCIEGINRFEEAVLDCSPCHRGERMCAELELDPPRKEAGYLREFFVTLA